MFPAGLYRSIGLLTVLGLGIKFKHKAVQESKSRRFMV